MSTQPKTFTDTTADDMIAVAQSAFWARYTNYLPITEQSVFTMAFLDDGDDFILGTPVTIKSGTIPLKGIVLSVNDFGALGTGGIIEISARALDNYIKSV